MKFLKIFFFSIFGIILFCIGGDIYYHHKYVCINGHYEYHERPPHLQLNEKYDKEWYCDKKILRTEYNKNPSKYTTANCGCK